MLAASGTHPSIEVIRRPARYIGTCAPGTLVAMKLIMGGGNVNVRESAGIASPTHTAASTALVVRAAPRPIKTGGNQPLTSTNNSRAPASPVPLSPVVARIMLASRSPTAIGEDGDSTNIIETRFPSLPRS